MQKSNEWNCWWNKMNIEFVSPYHVRSHVLLLPTWQKQIFSTFKIVFLRLLKMHSFCSIMKIAHKRKHENRRAIKSHANTGCFLVGCIRDLYYYLSLVCSFSIIRATDWIFSCLSLYDFVFFKFMQSISMHVLSLPGSLHTCLVWK